MKWRRNLEPDPESEIPLLPSEWLHSPPDVCTHSHLQLPPELCWLNTTLESTLIIRIRPVSIVLALYSNAINDSTNWWQTVVVINTRALYSAFEWSESCIYRCISSASIFKSYSNPIMEHTDWRSTIAAVIIIIVIVVAYLITWRGPGANGRPALYPHCIQIGL